MLRQLAFWNKNICPIFAFLDKLYYLFIPLFLLQLLDFLSFFKCCYHNKKSSKVLTFNCVFLTVGSI